MIPCSSQDIFRDRASQNGYDKTEIDFLDTLRQDFSEFRFIIGKKFAFRPPRTIVIGPQEPFWQLLALHEVSHALCKHKAFRMDVERLKMENEAWEQAKELAKRYRVGFDEDVAQRELDTYRDWLHQKSRCPSCGLTRFQTPDSSYHCPRCDNLT